MERKEKKLKEENKRVGAIITKYVSAQRPTTSLDISAMVLLALQL